MNPDAKTSQPHGAAFAWSVLLVLSACVLAFAFQTRKYFVDDAFTGFQYIHNLLSGNGFVFHAGDAPVEGVTNIGWLLVLTPFCWLAEPTVVVKLVGLALVLLVLTLTICLGRVFSEKFSPSFKGDSPIFADTKIGTVPSPKSSPTDDSAALVIVPTLMLAVSFDFIYFSLAGMETGLLAAILTVQCCIVLFRPNSPILAILGAMSFLVHPEAAVVYPLYVAISWAGEKGDRRKYLAGTIVFAALMGVITAVRFGFFHDVVPNTFHSKPSDLQLMVQNAYGFLMGQNTNVAFPVTGWLAIPILLLGYRRLRRVARAGADMLAAVCIAGLFFAVYSPPDWTALPRYFAPYLPAALMLLWAGILEALDLLLVILPRDRPNFRGHRPGTAAQQWSAMVDENGTVPFAARMKQPILAGLVVILAMTSVMDARNKMDRMNEFPGYVLAGKSLVKPALWMRDHLPDGATIATRRIGAVAYYSGLKIFDYTYGLPDPAVARLVARHGGRLDTPTEPALAELWRTRAPDYLLEDGLLMDQIILQAGGVRERFFIHGIEYHVIHQFSIGRDVQWVLAGRRLDPKNGSH